MHDCIHKIVFITNDALPSIKIPQSSDFDLQTGDSTEIVAKFMPSNDDPMIALIYCTYSELPILSQIIEMFNKQNLSHFFAVHIEEDNHNLETNAQVAFVWENNLSLSEFLFTTSYQFRLLEQRMKDRKSSAKYLARLLDMKQDQEDLIKIGRSLSTEKNMPKLLRQILMLSKKITGADAGSIYLVEEDENGKRIRFKYSHTFSKDLPLEEFVIPFDTNSIAGYVAVTGKVLNIPDVYKLSPNDPISFNKKFDLSNNYRSTSMIVIPMRNHANEVIGVVQLINCKEPIDPTFSTGNEAFEIALNTEEDFREKVRPFDRRYESLMESVAAQAAIAIENNRMIQQIQNQFEEFVKASVSAIESRDPATSGHSFRVAEICRRLALAINTEKGGAFAQNQFTDTQIKELEFAALLHDFGKVYIDPSIFMKEKKLYPFELQNLILKLNYLYKNVELQYTSDFFKNADTDQNSSIQKIETEKSKFLEMVLKIKNSIVALNEPTVSEANPAEIIENLNKQIAEIKCYDIEGKLIDIMTDEVKSNLSIKKGSLNDKERKEIESHVLHTYNFVSKIPWPSEFRKIPEIALMHHEKLDGTGYPNGFTEDKIPIQSRMIAIADIYDALTANDRPYKKSLPHEKALAILRAEAEKNKIDPNLYDLFARLDITIDQIKHEEEKQKTAANNY